MTLDSIAPNRAPIWELSLSAITDNSTVFSPYNVERAHGLFAGQYPKVERQMPFGGYEAHPAAGAAHPSSLVINAFPLTRWWFISDDDHRIVQIQENFIATNWRRLGRAPGEAVYPGFEVQLSEFQKAVEALRQLDPERPTEAPFPNPQGCEISYDNLIPLRNPDGDAVRLRDVLTMLAGDTREPVPIIGYQASWFKRLPDVSVDGPHELRIVISGGVSMGDMFDGESFLRLQIIGRSQISTWDECYSFFERAHAACHRELFDLTSKAVHATWKQ